MEAAGFHPHPDEPSHLHQASAGTLHERLASGEGWVSNRL
jgi:hypothetical protein